MIVWTSVRDSVRKHGSAVLVTVARVEGSSPREVGAHMIVTRGGFHGSIGGGALEWRAMAAAQKALGQGAGTIIEKFSLGPDLGQCCGGRVTVAIESFEAASLAHLEALAEREATGPFEMTDRIPGFQLLERFGEAKRRLYVFGAGHVGRALVMALAPLPFDVHWVDPRTNAFPRFVPGNVTLLATERPEGVLAEAPEGSLAFVMSHSHALDLAITDAALRNHHVAQVGLIGSATKRARFEKRLREAGVDEARIQGLICPIGVGGIRSKEPAAIAAATAAQCLILHEVLQATTKTERPLMVGGG